MGVKITGYAVSVWGNRNTGEQMFGIRVRVKGQWMNCCENNAPCLYPTRTAAKAAIKQMKSERTPTGLLKKAA
jgi:hypothetical protein